MFMLRSNHMYKCCDRQFEDEKSFKKHISSSYKHFLTSSDTIRLNIPKSYAESIVTDKEKLSRILGLSYFGDYVILPLPSNEIRKKPLGGILKRSLLMKLEGPTFDAGLINYMLSAKNIKYKLSFRLTGLGESSRLTIITTFEAEIGYLGKLFPGLVIRSLSNLISPDNLITRITNFLPAEKALA